MAKIYTRFVKIPQVSFGWEVGVMDCMREIKSTLIGLMMWIRLQPMKYFVCCAIVKGGCGSVPLAVGWTLPNPMDRAVINSVISSMNTIRRNAYAYWLRTNKDGFGQARVMVYLYSVLRNCWQILKPITIIIGVTEVCWVMKCGI